MLDGLKFNEKLKKAVPFLSDVFLNSRNKQKQHKKYNLCVGFACPNLGQFLQLDELFLDGVVFPIGSRRSVVWSRHGWGSGP